MSELATAYVEKTTEGGWRIADSRISLDSVVCAYWEGDSPEAIVEEFPTLTIEQVYGAIAFYLRNRQEIDDFLAKQDERWKALAAKSAVQHGALLRRLRKSRPQKAKE